MHFVTDVVAEKLLLLIYYVDSLIKWLDVDYSN